MTIKTMKEKISGFLKGFFPFSFGLFAIHYLINNFLETSLYYPLWGIYLFLFLAGILIFLALIYIHRYFSDKTGFAFMGLSFFKMLASILFLLPLMLNETEGVFFNLISFFVPYFLFLIFETVSAVKIINAD